MKFLQSWNKLRLILPLLQTVGPLCWDLFVLHLICFIFIYTVLLIIISNMTTILLPLPTSGTFIFIRRFGRSLVYTSSTRVKKT